MLKRISFGAIALLLFWAGATPSSAQQLPTGGGPISLVRRGGNGEIEVVSPSAVASVKVKRSAPALPAIAAKPTLPPPAVADTVGTRFTISPTNLPLPNTTPPDRLVPYDIQRPTGVMPKVPKGFSVSIFVAHVGNARWLRVAPNGDVFLAASGNGKIMMLRDSKGAGVADTITTFAAGFLKPHGMAFHEGGFYIADLRAIWRLPYHDGDMVLIGEPKRVTKAPDLRPEGQHWTREIAFDSKGRFYLAMGARGDLADDDPPPDASVQEVAADGSLSLP